MLTRHVVRAARDLPERRTAHDQQAVTEGDPVGQVRRTTRELQHRELSVETVEVRPQVGLERVPVEFLPGTDGRDLDPRFLRALDARLFGDARHHCTPSAGNPNLASAAASSASRWVVGNSPSAGVAVFSNCLAICCLCSSVAPSARPMW